MKDKKKYDKQVTCYECGKYGHHKINYLRLIKHKNKEEFSKMKEKYANGGRAYITWEKKEEKSFSSSSVSPDDGEISHLCLMTRHNEKDLEVNNSDSRSKPLYNQL